MGTLLVETTDSGRENIVRRVEDTRHDTLQDTWQMSCWDMICDLTSGNITSRDDTGRENIVRRVDTRHDTLQDTWRNNFETISTTLGMMREASLGTIMIEAMLGTLPKRTMIETMLVETMLVETTLASGDDTS